VGSVVEVGRGVSVMVAEGAAVTAAAMTSGSGVIVDVKIMVTKPLGRASAIPDVAVTMMMCGVWLGSMASVGSDVPPLFPNPLKTLNTMPIKMMTKKILTHPLNSFRIKTFQIPICCFLIF